MKGQRFKPAHDEPIKVYVGDEPQQPITKRGIVMGIRCRFCHVLLATVEDKSVHERFCLDRISKHGNQYSERYGNEEALPSDD